MFYGSVKSQVCNPCKTERQVCRHFACFSFIHIIKSIISSPSQLHIRKACSCLVGQDTDLLGRHDVVDVCGVLVAAAERPQGHLVARAGLASWARLTDNLLST